MGACLQFFGRLPSCVPAGLGSGGGGPSHPLRPQGRPRLLCLRLPVGAVGPLSPAPRGVRIRRVSAAVVSPGGPLWGKWRGQRSRSRLQVPFLGSKSRSYLTKPLLGWGWGLTLPPSAPSPNGTPAALWPGSSGLFRRLVPRMPGPAGWAPPARLGLSRNVGASGGRCCLRPVSRGTPPTRQPVHPTDLHLAESLFFALGLASFCRSFDSSLLPTDRTLGAF